MSHLLTRRKMQTHNNTLANLCRGVGERVLFTDSKGTVPIRPLDKVFESRLHHYRERLTRRVGWQSPVTHDEFVDFYKGPRQATYRRAVEGLRLLAVRPRDAILKTFVKAEKLDLDTKPDPVPRVIQPRNPRYNVEVGCYLRPVEKKIYSAIDELFGTPTIMSQYNSYRTAEIIHEKWTSFQNPVCVGLDASRFDQHVSVQALKFEHMLYDMIFKSGHLRNLLTWQVKNRGIAVAKDGWFRYEKTGSRMSGDMNTSLGNKILMCLMGKAYIDSKPFHVEFVNNGDDCLMITERKNLPLLEDINSYFKDFGFKIVREEPVFEMEHIEFCQSRPVFCNGIWRMMRKISSCFTKDVTCVSLGHSVVEYRRWLNDVSKCGLAFSADLPVLGSFYRMLGRLGVEGSYSTHAMKEYSWYYNASNNAKCKSDTTDAYGRYSFWLSTGITPDQQTEIESELDQVVWGDNERQFIDHLNILIHG